MLLDIYQAILNTRVMGGCYDESKENDKYTNRRGRG